MKIHFVIHKSFEVPGAIEHWANEKGHQVSHSLLHEGDSLPADTVEIDYLIVMGGPQCPATTIEECPYFDAAREISLIRDAIERDKLVLGVCLGAQLVGEALGAPFENSPNREIGVFDLELTEAAKDDPIFSSFPERFPCGHWHGDMPGLTDEAAVLATSEGCPRQIVRYSPKVYGFQCHFEFTPAAIEAMIENCADDLAEADSKPYIQNADQLRANDYAGINARLFTFLDAMEARFVSSN